MDQKQLAQLDPKLREAYQRVMNTRIPSPTSPSATVVPPIMQNNTIPVPPPTNHPPLTPQPTTSTQPVSTPTPSVTTPHIVSSSTVNTTTVPHLQQNLSQGFVAPEHKSGGKASPILWIIGGILFLIAYTLFWIRYFNVSVPLPFLQ